MDKSEEKFYEMYCKNILPKLRNIEPQRKHMVNVFIIEEALLVISVIIFAFVSIGSLLEARMTLSEPPMLYFGAVLFITLCIMAMPKVYQYYVIKFKELIKLRCMDDIAKEFALEWNYKYEIDLFLKSSGVFPYYDKIKYDDTFHGKYNNTEFDIQEITLLRDKPCFKGVVICMQSNKVIKAQTIITNKINEDVHNRLKSPKSYFISSILFILIAIYCFCINNIVYSTLAIAVSIIDILGGINQIKNDKYLESVYLEDLNFDKYFNVSSEDQIEARYLVTPAFMERLLNLQKAFITKDIRCSFWRDKVLFAIPTQKDLFEIGNLFAPLTSMQQIIRFYKEINSVYNIIDYFKLTEKTGL